MDWRYVAKEHKALNPGKLLSNIYRATDDGAIMFVTASINMESVDHLFLFHSDDEVAHLVESAGFKVVDREIAFLTVQPYCDDPKLVSKLKKWGNPATSIIIATNGEGIAYS